MASFAFSSPGGSHIILLANVVLILLILQIESRRYQIYAIFRTRVRLLEKQYISPLFNQIAQDPQAIDHRPHIDPALLESILSHKSPITRLEAIAWRMRRNYIYLLGVVYMLWLAKIMSNYNDQPWLSYVDQQAKVGGISGLVVFVIFSAMLLSALCLSFYVTERSEDDDI